MACNKPIKAWHLGYDSEGCPVISYSPIRGGMPILMDCGSCIGCRLKKSKEWAVRCLKELEYYDKACFVTLTYNDNCLPYAFSPSLMSDYDNGIPLVEPTLCRRDVILFNKRLRTQLDRRGIDVKNGKLKIYYAGEYGDENHRPHY